MSGRLTSALSMGDNNGNEETEAQQYKRISPRPTATKTQSWNLVQDYTLEQYTVLLYLLGLWLLSL